ncbi:hypothetical protein [Nitratireductor sp. ZSWI3]|uniref:hypothetical protein n=1 Tax=Nitratireductor sp. ZSWI3 TaxID=2966359 RepID=UPI00215049CC|nr:hypothetical protein [Nitratireductor sp. ZSWI3]MCR4265479.1 hypothetical protein [Nitratireductor sp. ZSWI3]
MVPISCGAAFAHAADRAHVLLLPTHYYLFGGVLAVALSFLVLAFLPASGIDRLAARRLRLLTLPFEGRAAVSLVSFVFLAGLVVAGALGSRDPLSNPLPLTVWTLLWVGLTLVQGVLGNLWAWLNPWYGPWRLAVRAGVPPAGYLRLPAALGLMPAFLLLFAFAWFELVYPAPDDPARLALAVSAYWCFAMAGAVLFGYRHWVRRAEFLSVFFAMIARLSLFSLRRGSRGRPALFLGVPGHRLREAAPLPPSGLAFLLLALSSVSFDGFMRTFFWFGLIGVNPLEYPGRSALLVPNTLGLAAMFLLLCAAFLLAVRFGSRLAGDAPPAHAGGFLVWSIIPIALAYHFSHYLVAFAINGQYALSALSDPLVRGWDLFGTAGLYVQAGVTLGAQSAWIIWNAQALAIIGGHVLAVVIAHLMAHRLFGTTRRASLSQLPLVVLMIGYTVFGLWLLSAPTAG